MITGFVVGVVFTLVVEALVIAIIVLFTSEKHFTYELQWTGDGDEAIITEQPTGFEYVGSCTVWHSYHGGWRCSSSLEAKLADVWEHHKRSRDAR